MFYILTALAGFFGVLITVPFNSMFYNLAKNDIADEFIIFNEVFVNLGRVITLLLVLLFIANIKLSFLVAAVSYIYFFRF